jgi:hypothetical protein
MNSLSLAFVAAIVFGTLIVLGIVVAVVVHSMARKVAAPESSDLQDVPLSPPRQNPGRLTDEQVAEIYQKIPGEVKNVGLFFVLYGLIRLIVSLALMQSQPGAAFTLPIELLFLVGAILAFWIREPASLGFLGLLFLADTICQMLLARRGFSASHLFMLMLGFASLGIYLARRRVFMAYSSLPDDKKPIPEYNRANRLFPIFSVVLGGASIFVLIVVGVIYFVFVRPWPELLASLGVLLGILAAAFGLSGLIYVFERRWLLIIGTLTGIISVFFSYY